MDLDREIPLLSCGCTNKDAGTERGRTSTEERTPVIALHKYDPIPPPPAFLYLSLFQSSPFFQQNPSGSAVILLNHQGKSQAAPSPSTV
jgi:hypothetical protein